ncbi:MAG: TonB-dependent receptor [Gemmatimonadetes bacterium]|nr:TonB-dependent receptor [Gemmatimonadota bacterium]
MRPARHLVPRKDYSITFFLFLLFTGTVSGQTTGALTGRVIAADGTPAADAEVRIQDLARRVSVGESGQFAFLNLPAGSFLVEATSPRYGRAVDRVNIQTGATTTITLEMDPLYQLDELVISAGPLSARRSETYQPSSALTGLDLAKTAKSSLGETLAGEPGVSSTYNGPGASRPIIRGLGGDRVRILEGGIGSGDVSSQGPDHAVGLEPLAAERIEIVRSPATLLYGSSAVGGVVNVIDKRIPREHPGAPITGSLTALGGTVSEERTGALELNGAFNSRWAWHVSGLRRATDDYAIPGFAEHQHEGEEHSEEEEEIEGILENSAVETTRAAFGLSWIGSSGYLGASVSGLNSDYGVPGHGHGEGHGEEDPGMEEEGHGDEDVTIGLEQRRLDIEGSWRFGEGTVRGLEGRFGFADYLHTEFEGEEVGTKFTNQQWEGRLELQHAHTEMSSGTLGVQIGSRDFKALGEEAFVPPSNSLSFAGFIYEEFERERVRYQVGARAEGQLMEQTEAGFDENHFGLSVSAGLSWTISEAAGLSFTAARSVKLPSLEELFSNGPHAATLAYEIGDPNLDPEEAYSLDATLRLSQGTFRGEFTGFLTFFDGFIFQDFTGDEEDGLPVTVFDQSDATHAGFEAALEFDLIHRGNHHLLVEGWTDYVRAKLPDLDRNLPRIPPLRVGTGLRYDGGTLRGDVGITLVTDQARIAPLEEETEGHTMLDASVGYRLFTGEVVHDFVLQATNLADQEARLHTSYVKELAPLPGREIKLIYRVYF